MVVRHHEILQVDAGEAQFRGLRMTADEFLRIPEDGFKYELVDGVVIRSPTPLPRHQRIAVEIVSQIKWFLRAHPVGEVFMELDVYLGVGPARGDLVYAPDVIFVSAERVRSMEEKIVGAPELVVEVISRGSRRMDTITKREDYERCGVREYWIIDPHQPSITFLRLRNGRFESVDTPGDSFASEAVPGFVLDLKPVRESFKPF